MEYSAIGVELSGGAGVGINQSPTGAGVDDHGASPCSRKPLTRCGRVPPCRSMRLFRPCRLLITAWTASAPPRVREFASTTLVSLKVRSRAILTLRMACCPVDFTDKVFRWA